MGQFYASLESGHTTASVALKRLASCTAKNRFYRANRDLGRIFKTEFLLSYLSEPPLRSRIRKGLLKVEQLHALARDVYYGRRGRINARELHEQMNSCSCLTLILACVIYWQAKEISRVVRWCQSKLVFYSNNPNCLVVTTYVNSPDRRKSLSSKILWRLVPRN